jgi:hypothetical protein
VTSPVTGTIVQWRVTTLGTGRYAIRVLRPAGGDSYTGAGTSAQEITTAGAYTVAANLPIQAGDLLGLDLPNSNGVAGAIPAGSADATWVPNPLDGVTAAPVFTDSNIELAFNADVQSPDPPTTAKKCKKKKKHKRSASSAKKKCKKKKKK